jgi:transcriptional regulator with XRE-family HTH domain
MKGETMGKRLQRLRRERGMSQRALALAAGVPLNTLQQWEQDRRVPSLDGFFRLANGLGVTLDELAGRSATGQPSAPAPAEGEPKGKGRGKRK